MKKILFAALLFVGFSAHSQVSTMFGNSILDLRSHRYAIVNKLCQSCTVDTNVVFTKDSVLFKKPTNLSSGSSAAGSNGQLQFVTGTSFNATPRVAWDTTSLIFKVKGSTSATDADAINIIDKTSSNINISLQSNNSVYGGGTIQFRQGNGALDFWNFRALLASGSTDWKITSANASQTGALDRLRIAGAATVANVQYLNSKVSITNGTTAVNPTALLHLDAGSTASNSAPLKFTSGSLMTTAEAGAVEFLTDAFYGTITTGAARKTFAFLESPAFTGSPTAPTASIGDNTTKIANTIYVDRVAGYSFLNLTTAGNAGTLSQIHCNYITIDPSGSVGSISITTPASPNNGDMIVIVAGGQVASGSAVTTGFTLTANTGQSIYGMTFPIALNGGDGASFVWDGANSKWKRLKF